MNDAPQTWFRRRRGLLTFHACAAAAVIAIGFVLVGEVRKVRSAAARTNDI